MSESILPIIVLLAVGLGAARAAMLRSRGFVARGRKYAEPSAPPAPVAIAAMRAQASRRRPKLASAHGTTPLGVAR